MSDRKVTMEDILVAFSIKYDGVFKDIYQAIKTKEYISDEQVESYMDKVSENYVTIISEDYPDAFKGSENDCPPMVMFYEGNLECIDDFEQYAVPHDTSRRFFMGFMPAEDGMEYCFATERQEDVEKISNHFFKHHPEINFVNYNSKSRGNSLS